MRDLRIIALLPALNEEGKVGNSIKGTKKYVKDVLVIDDGSTDNTADEAKRFGAKVIKHNKNRGVGAGQKTGIKYAIKHGFNIVLFIASDDQDDPNAIPEMIKKIEEGYDFVVGSRYLGSTENMPLFRSITTKLYTLFFQFVTGYKVTDASTGYRMIRLHVYDVIDLNNPKTDRYEFEPYTIITALKHGFKYTEVPAIKKFHKDKSYSKMKPFKGWWSITKPLFEELLFRNKS